MGYRAAETSRRLAPTRAVSLLVRPSRGPGVAQGHLLKIVLARTRKKTLELADEAATRELVDGERVRLYEWAYRNGLRLLGATARVKVWEM